MAPGLVIARECLSRTTQANSRSLVHRLTALLNAMNYGVFYDAGNQCTDITAGQMYGGYIVDQGPARFHYGHPEHRDAHRSLYGHRHSHNARRCLVAHLARCCRSTNPPPPPTGCAMDTANFDWQGQYPPHGY